MDWFNIVYFVTHYAADASKHFGLAFLAGSLAFFLIWTTLHVVYWGLRRLTRWPGNTGVGFCITCLSLLGSLSMALLSHAALDAYSIWFTTPLGPSLNLVR